MDKSDMGPQGRPALSDNALVEPTRLLSQVTPRPKVTARAVIVYEPEPRPRRGLWWFTAMLVALTVGVILGQTSAYQEPSRRSVTAAQAAPLATYETPAAAPTPSGPVPGPQITAQLGSAKSRLLEVTGAATALRIRSADLGPMLFSVDTADGSAMPGFVDTPGGPRLSLIRTGLDATGIQLNSKVRWTIRLTGEATTQEIDMRAGGLAGIELAGGSADATLELPRPAKAVALRVTGTVGNLRIQAGDDVPVRLRLGQGADSETLDGTQRQNAKPGTVLASPGWQSAKKRYDIRADIRLASVIVDHSPGH